MKFLDKRIITHKIGNNPTDDNIYSNGFIISKNYSHTIDHYNKLAAEAKKDFPGLKDSEIECFVVTESTYNNYCAGIHFSLPSNTTHKKYRSLNQIDFRYN